MTANEADDRQINTHANATEIQHKEWRFTGEDMQQLMKLCDNAENRKEVVEYLHKRFSPDGYRANINILQWFEDNDIGASHWSN